jgi:hypothetical protein
MPTLYGFTDNTVSDALKASVMQGDTMVIGLIAAGTSRSMQSTWDSPLMQANLGSVPGIATISNLAQITSGQTSLTTLNTTQVWQGNQPITFTLNLAFVALTDAVAEVMQPCKFLEQFASADVQNGNPIGGSATDTVLNMIDSGAKFIKDPSANGFGRIPGEVTICIGRQMIYPHCVIESISIPLDKERDVNGNLLRAEVSLNIATKTMINRTDIPATWGLT